MNYKNTFLTIFFTVVGVVSLNAQEFLPNSLSSNLEIGIYKNFEEFKNNTPSIKLEHQVLQTQKKTGGIFDGTKTTFFHLDISKEEAKNIGKVYGFCDGKNIFINEFNPELKPNILFMKVGFIENYCIFEYKAFSDINSLPLKNKVIDMETGRLKILSKRILKNFIVYESDISMNIGSLPIGSASGS